MQRELIQYVTFIAINLSFQEILLTLEIKQWSLFLSSNENKNALIKLIHDQWHLESYTSPLKVKLPNWQNKYSVKKQV